MPDQMEWTVIGNPVLVTGQDSAGNFVQGRKFTYQLSNGATGQVWVATSELTPEAVKAAINADAQKLSAVLGLTSGD